MSAMSAELERRAQNLRPVETIVVVCLNCGEAIARSSIFEVRATGELWVDPFAAGGVGMFTANHPWFCKAKRGIVRRLLGRRLPRRTAEVMVRNVA